MLPESHLPLTFKFQRKLNMLFSTRHGTFLFESAMKRATNSCRCAICKMQRNVPGATYFRFYRNVGIVIYFQWAWISNGVYTSVFSGHSLQPPLKCLQKWQRRTRSRNWPPRWFGRDYSFNEIILSRSPPCSVFDSRNHVGFWLSLWVAAESMSRRAANYCAILVVLRITKVPTCQKQKVWEAWAFASPVQDLL